MRWRLDPGQIEVVDEDVAAVLRTKTPAEKLSIAFEANRIARELLAADIQAKHPTLTGQQITDEVRHIIMCGQVPDDLARRATDMAYVCAGIPVTPAGSAR